MGITPRDYEQGVTLPNPMLSLTMREQNQISSTGISEYSEKGHENNCIHNPETDKKE